jgi:hypothetical protein
MKRPGQAVADCRGAISESFDILQPVEHDDELVSTQSRREVGSPDMGLQPASNNLQHLVANRVTIGIVEGLELFQVQKQQAERTRLCQRRLHHSGQAQTAADAGQGIGFGQGIGCGNFRLQ